MSFQFHRPWEISPGAAVLPLAAPETSPSARPLLDEADQCRWRDCIDHLSDSRLWPSPQQERALLAFLGPVLLRWDGWPPEWGLLLAEQQCRTANAAVDTDIISNQAPSHRQIVIGSGADAAGRYRLVMLRNPTGPDARFPGWSTDMPALETPGPSSVQLLRGTSSAQPDFFDALSCGLRLVTRSREPSRQPLEGLPLRRAFVEWLRQRPVDGLADLPVPPPLVWRRAGEPGLGAGPLPTDPVPVPVPTAIGPLSLATRGGEVKALAALIRGGGWSEQVLDPLLLVLPRLPGAAALAVRGKALTMVSGGVSRCYRCFPGVSRDRPRKILRDDGGRWSLSTEQGIGRSGSDAFLEVYRQHLGPPACALSISEVRHHLADVLEANELPVSVALTLSERFPGHPDPDRLYRQCWSQRGLTLEGAQLLDPGQRPTRPLDREQLTLLLDQSRSNGVYWRKLLFDQHYDLFQAQDLLGTLPDGARAPFIQEEVGWLLHVYGTWQRLDEALRMSWCPPSDAMPEARIQSQRMQVETLARQHGAGSLLAAARI